MCSHLGHLKSSVAWHVVQNCTPSGFAAPHFGQVIVQFYCVLRIRSVQCSRFANSESVSTSPASLKSPRFGSEATNPADSVAESSAIPYLRRFEDSSPRCAARFCKWEAACPPQTPGICCPAQKQTRNIRVSRGEAAFAGRNPHP